MSPVASQPSARKVALVSAGISQYPAATHEPRSWSSPSSPAGTGVPSGSTIRASTSPIGVPMVVLTVSGESSGPEMIEAPEVSESPYRLDSLALGKAPRTRSASDGSRFDPPTTQVRIREVSISANDSAASSIVNMVGTPANRVIGFSAIARATRPGWNAGRSVNRPPETSEVPNAQVRPPTWLNGRRPSRLSALLCRYLSTCPMAEASRLRCVSVAPFGRPVVPEV